MKSILVSIEGTTPLLCNRFTDSAQMSATSGSRQAAVGEQEGPTEQAKRKLYLDPQGNPVIPQPNLLRCLVDAGKFFKQGRSKVTTQKSSLLAGCLDVLGVELPIRSRAGWTVDTRPVRIPATGGRILCHRPCFHDWQVSFTLELDTDMLNLGLLREIVDAAGKRIGLGDFRPDCKGPFGKFVVVEWVVSRESDTN